MNDRKRCNNCDREKPLSAFPANARSSDGLHHWCNTCCRVSMLLYRRTAKYRSTITDYLQKPEVQARKREIDAERRESRKPQQREYRNTPRANVLHCRRQARVRLRKAECPKRRKQLESLIAQYDRELKRMAEACEPSSPPWATTSKPARATPAA